MNDNPDDEADPTGFCCIGCSRTFPVDVDREAHLAACDGPRAYWNRKGGERDGARTCPLQRPATDTDTPAV